ncbi:hypothetical protein KDA_06740 [Dictyobacter alpinus]|uniref:Activator of Hsp90 ATPase homologue 1/2-like C-terminal domain-containing protein n=1 Tax=Dictyobacter alpinus TaxID=2014873 RepID=A0A402B1E8_9CHLR|nr:SRPBCC domain-containing protein [Dictyobacter alpinus]GCE25190.1 hypothetical protein KDA_06740 [Dictyobacter alpinus]
MEAVVITQSIVIQAERSRVWRAITMPEHIAKWFQPIHFERFAIGEAVTFDRGAKGSIAIIEPMERFGFHGQIALSHPAQTLVIFTLKTVPEGTRLTVTEQGFEALPEEVRESYFKGNMQGWEKVLSNLTVSILAGHHD